MAAITKIKIIIIFVINLFQVTSYIQPRRFSMSFFITIYIQLMAS